MTARAAAQNAQSGKDVCMFHDPAKAAAGYLASILLGALQQGPLEERLQRLEATLDLKRE